ncbi:MAG TPA: 16S rRNA (guanine(966)-N(2))-methyltransferase RsmD [Bryobacteraceae bacterium]|nr:16S rRNA (guanine(966)-N(2))-methyltransferase RsmD [Bryobacteraceae bacterium]
MRVIAGQFRSRPLKSLPGLDTRPTPDRLRETLFDVLAPRIQGAIFADLYAGTGAVGIEALSRGAKKTIFVESNRSAVRVIRENLKSLELRDCAEVRHRPAISALPEIRADIVFLDPPYRLEREYFSALEMLGQRGPGLEPGLVIAQHDARLVLAESYTKLRRTRELKQGDNVLSFYEP